jgi:hypothetical protein
VVSFLSSQRYEKCWPGISEVKKHNLLLACSARTSWGPQIKDLLNTGLSDSRETGVASSPEFVPEGHRNHPYLQTSKSQGRQKKPDYKCAKHTCYQQKQIQTTCKCNFWVCFLKILENIKSREKLFDFLGARQYTGLNSRPHSC